MSSTRIDIFKNKGCFTDSYGIDRNMPAIMNGNMSDREWELFCNQIDQHIIPLNKLGYLLLAGYFTTFIGMMATATFIIFMNVNFSPVIFICLVSGFFVFSCYLWCIAGNAIRKVSKVCEATSRDIPNVSLSLRRHHSSNDDSFYYYIEVSLSEIKVASINDSDRTVSPMDVVAVPMYDLEAGDPTSTSHGSNKTLVDASVMPPANNSSSSIKMSWRQRMDNLQRIKHMLTTEEYEKKREEILADVQS
jgi:hypothetical protein